MSEQERNNEPFMPGVRVKVMTSQRRTGEVGVVADDPDLTETSRTSAIPVRFPDGEVARFHASELTVAG